MESLKKLIVHGTKHVNTDGSITYNLEPSNRDDDNRNEIEFHENDELLEVALQDDSGTSWIVDRSTMHELFPEMDPALRKGGNRSDDAPTARYSSTMYGERGRCSSESRSQQKLGYKLHRRGSQ